MTGKNEIAGIQLRILLLEDSTQDFELIQEQLSDAGYILDLTHVENEPDFTTALQENLFDIILSDFNLPRFDAFGALQISKEICPDVPFICISGSIGEETAIELLKQGAVDYVLKDRPERLPFALNRAIKEQKEKEALKLAEEELRRKEANFRTLTENIPDIIARFDKNLRHIYINPAIEKVTGISSGAFLGKTNEELGMPNDVIMIWNEKMRSVFETTKQQIYEFEFQTPKGTLYFLSRVMPELTDDGKVNTILSVTRDITESKLAEIALINAKEKAEESDKLKTAFINNISHEIRTPLNSILGFGRLLGESELSAEVRMEYFALLEKSSNRLMNTVSDYMDMARIVTGAMEVHQKEIVLQPLFREIVEDSRYLFTEKKIGFEVVIPPESDDLILHSDSEFIRRILNIFLDNALKFTKEGSISCGYKIKSGFLEFFVQDTGIGIVPDKLGLIFDMFSQEVSSNTRGYEGSGLGLTIAQALVHLLGGEIKVTSEKGKGSVFTFTIPYTNPVVPDNSTIAKTMESNKTNRLLVLIAEDEESNYLYMKVLMKLIGCDYIHVVNGAEAVEMCRHNDKISLVLMDIKMPIMNGLEAMQLIHGLRPELPVIATTAYAETGDEHRFMAAGCDGFLAKPLKKENLLTLLEKYR